MEPSPPTIEFGGSSSDNLGSSPFYLRPFPAEVLLPVDKASFSGGLSLPVNFFSTGWHVPQPCLYGAAVLGAAFVIRLATSGLWAIEQSHEDSMRRPFWRHWLINLRGWRDRGGDQFPSDCWFNSVLGTLELIAYPMFMAADGWAAIGAWLGIKTVARWSFWSTTAGRATFNLYLIGNALVLLSSMLIAGTLVVVGSAP